MTPTTCRLLVLLLLGTLGIRAYGLPLAIESGKDTSLDPKSSNAARSGLMLPTPEAMTDPTTQIPPEVLAKLGGSQSASLSALGLELRKRLELKPGDPNLMHGLATVLYHQGGEKEALSLWSSASKRDPNLAPAELMSAIHGIYALLDKGAAADAQVKLAAAEKKFAKNPHFHLMRGEQAMRGANVRGAETAYRKAYELAPKLYVTNLNYARFLDAAKRDFAAAGPRYEAATRLAPQRPEVWSQYAGFLARQERPEDALGAFRKLRALDGKAPLPERRMAEISAARGKHEEARKWYLEAKTQRPSDTEMQIIRIALGDTLLRLKRFDEARTEIQAALKHQEAPPLVFAVATIDDAEGKTEAAERGYRRTLALMPNNALAANNLAMLLLKTDKGAAEALALAKTARAAIPNNAIIEGTWGCALAANGRGKEAVTVLRAVVAGAKDDPWTHYCLGKELAAQRNKKEAADHLQQVLRLDATFKRRAEVSNLIERMH